MLTVQDYAWAYRLITMQLSDAYKLIENCGASDLGKLVEKAETLQKRFSREGKGIVTARDLLANIRGIRTAAEAKFILEIMER